MSDWYRCKTWETADEQEFFAKLGRAKKEGRPQYLKIQAIELVVTGDKNLLDAAEALLSKLLSEYPEDKFNRSSALHTLGDIYQQRGNVAKAIDYYRQAIDFETVYPNVKTHAYLDYSELIIKTDKRESFAAVEKIILERIPGLLFPIEKYKAFSILAIVNNFKGDTAAARHYADVADENANAETSGLRYHKHLGVVKERELWLDRKVKDG